MIRLHRKLLDQSVGIGDYYEKRTTSRAKETIKEATTKATEAVKETVEKTTVKASAVIEEAKDAAADIAKAPVVEEAKETVKKAVKEVAKNIDIKIRRNNYRITWFCSYNELHRGSNQKKTSKTKASKEKKSAFM